MDFTIPSRARATADKIKASGFDGVLINITNPCDIVTRELALHLGLPRGRVFGTGTGPRHLPSVSSALARQTGLDHKSITCLHDGRARQPAVRALVLRQLPRRAAGRSGPGRTSGSALTATRCRRSAIGGGWVDLLRQVLHRVRHRHHRRGHGLRRAARREASSCPPARSCAASTAKRACSRVFPASSVKTASSRSSELPLTADEKATFHACCEGIRHNMEHLKEI